jgi:ATP-dependent Lon protease
MKWSFSKGMGTMQDLGLVGAEGEYYYHPSKRANLKIPSAIAGNQPILPKGSKPKGLQTVPIFPYNSVLVPMGTDWLNIFEMKHRQLINDVGDGVFGFSHYSQSNQKLSLVGTLARIKDRKLLSDGRTFVVVEGVQRFYLQEFINEKPYVRAKVQTFKDYTEMPEILDELEAKTFMEVRVNVMLMEKIFPNKNYTISPAIMKYRPSLALAGTRSIELSTAEATMQRRSDFSFAVMDMLQITPPTKLMLLQEHILEKRLLKIIKILETGGSYLRAEVLKKGMLSDEGVKRAVNEIMTSTKDIDGFSSGSELTSWQPENFVEGKWVQKAILM